MSLLLGPFVSRSVRSFGVFSSRACLCSSGASVRRFIEQNTEVSRDHLTPEIGLRLLTPRCRFWHSRPETWPYTDPYWAIYWPGGQALSRYLLDNPAVVGKGSVLDLGSGCGATAMAARMSGASRVLANDIDPVAGTAIALNCELNSMKPLPVLTTNIMDTEPTKWSLIVLGDMFYDEELANSLQHWLRDCVYRYGTKVLIGDPGRPQFVSHHIQRELRQVAEYPLSESTKLENYGLMSSSVWSYEP